MNLNRRNALRNMRDAITLAVLPGGMLIMRPAEAVVAVSDPDLAQRPWQWDTMIKAGLGQYLGDPWKRAFAVTPNQPGYTTVWGGQVGQPGVPLIAYPRFQDPTPGSNYVIGGTALAIVGMMSTGPFAAAAVIMGTAATGQGAAMGAAAALNPPVAVTVFSPLVDNVYRPFGMQGAWVIQFIRPPAEGQAPYEPAALGPYGPFDPSQLPACVACDSWLPGGRQAGDIKVGDWMLLEDGSYGQVTYSERKVRPGFRPVTTSGIALDCSDTAPIWTPEGYVKAPETLGKWVMTDDGVERVTQLQPLGPIAIQHLTVGNRAFWAGKQKGKYILHHNLKQE